MTQEETIRALRAHKVETGSLACLGCGYEHKCTISGCAIIRSAIALLEKMGGDDNADHHH